MEERSRVAGFLNAEDVVEKEARSEDVGSGRKPSDTCNHYGETGHWKKESFNFLWERT